MLLRSRGPSDPKWHCTIPAVDVSDSTGGIGVACFGPSDALGYIFGMSTAKILKIIRKSEKCKQILKRIKLEKLSYFAKSV